MDETADVLPETPEQRRARIRVERVANMAKARETRAANAEARRNGGPAPPLSKRAQWKLDHERELEERKTQRAEARQAAHEKGQFFMPKDPPASVVDTPEFKEALAAAAQAAIAPFLESLTANNAKGEKATAPVAGEAEMALFRGIAMAMAEVADQGTDRKRISPEILAQREAAAAKLKEVLAEVRANGEQPVYQLKNKVQVNLRGKGETIIEPLWLGNDKIHYPTEISSPDMPNLAMVPINEPAKRIFALFLESIGSIAEQELQEPDGIAMTRGGTVVRGNAALQVARQIGGDPSNWVGHDRPETDFVEVRRNQPSQTKDVRVLGTIQPPARQNA